jgi:hypothetical protein
LIARSPHNRIDGDSIFIGIHEIPARVQIYKTPAVAGDTESICREFAFIASHFLMRKYFPKPPFYRSCFRMRFSPVSWSRRELNQGKY